MTQNAFYPASSVSIGSVSLAAGTNIIGKVGIDQTTPGTTNAVQVIGSLPAGAATLGAVNVLGGNATAVKVDGSAVTQPVSGTFWQATQPVSGTVAVTGTFWQTTQPISAASLPLPTGAATSALQTTGNTSLATIATNTPALGQAAMAASTPVVLASNQSNVPTSAQVVATGSNQIKGKIAGASLTTTYATVITPSFITATLFIFNSCNQTIVVSINAGTTDCFELEIGEAATVDFGANGRSIAASTAIQAKALSAVPTSGTVRITAIG